MVPPDRMPRSSPPAAPRDRRMLREETRTQQRPGAMLGRRDVATVPWIALCAVAGALALSLVLRDTARGVDDNLFAGAIVLSAVGGALALLRNAPMVVRHRGNVGLYLGLSLAITALLTGLALQDARVGSVAFAGALPLAAYAGLVLPPRRSPVSIVIIMAATIGVEIADPQARALDAVLVALLILTGWFIGLFGHLAHARVARRSRMLASYDRITRTLNRRGFLEQLDHVLARCSGPDLDVALLVISVTDFTRVRDEGGRAAGDELVAWIGATLPGALPPSAELGRLDANQFAVLIEGVSARRAQAVGEAARKTLSARTDAYVGVATSQTLSVAPDDLVRVADAALDLAIDAGPTGTGVVSLVAGTLRMADPSRVRLRRSDETALSFAQLRATGKPPRVPSAGAVYSRMITQGLIAIAVAGIAVIVDTWMGSGHSIYDDLIRYAGGPWVLWLLALTWLSRSHGTKIEGVYHWILFVGTTLALSVGVGAAMLADGGITAPITAALFAKVLFDGAVTPPRRGLVSVGVIAAAWAVVAILGPSSALWAAPLDVAILLSSYAVGRIGRRAFIDVTRYSQSLARTDPLTRAGNRFGFDEAAEEAMADARAGGQPFAVLAVDLDDFEGVNAREGHAVGDERLVQVARELEAACPGAASVARVGGDEFLVVLRADDDEAAAAARRVKVALAAITPVSVGYASYPGDGDELDRLLLQAMRRCRGQKSQASLRTRAATRSAAPVSNAA